MRSISDVIIRSLIWMLLKIRQELIYQVISKGNPNFKIQVKFTLSALVSKVAPLGFGLFIDKDIFAIGSINNSYYKYLFCYLQLDKDNS